MKPTRQVLMLIVLAIAAVAFAGCGGGNEELEKATSELRETKAQLEQANMKIAQLQQSLDEAQSQTEQDVTEEATAMPDEPGMEEAETAEEGSAESAGAEQDVVSLQAKIASLMNENKRLQGLLEEMEAKIAAQVKEKVAPVESPMKDVPTALPK